MRDPRIPLLKLYLKSLPLNLPQPAEDSPLNQLLTFSLDPEWVEDLGSEDAAVNRGLETALKDYLPRNDRGIFFIKNRGPAIEALALVIEVWLQRYPDSFYLDKWLQDSLESAKAVLTYHKIPLPVPESAQAGSASDPQPEQPTTQPKTVSKKSKGQKKTKASTATARKPAGLQRRNDTKILTNFDDPNYEDESEVEDTRAGGAKTSDVLLRCSVVCRKRNSDGTLDEDLRVRCKGSASCNSSWAHPRNKARILEHAALCGVITNIDQGRLHLDILKEASKNKNGLYERIMKQLNQVAGTKRGRDDSDLDDDGGQADADPDIAAPALKRRQSAPLIRSTNAASTSGSNLKAPNLKQIAQGEGRKQLHEAVNYALVAFLVGCGLPPSLVNHKLFRDFCASLNRVYLPPERTRLEDKLIPECAATMRLALINFLRNQRDLTMTFDGGKLTRKKFWSIHVTTPRRQSFCLELDDVTGISQTGEYLAESTMKWIELIGPSRIIAIGSDKGSNANKGRRLVTTKHPHIFDLCDACHNIHNACKDICSIEGFKETIAELRALLSFMSTSTYTRDLFDAARSRLGIKRGVVSMSDTRFGTVYWSLESVLEGMPAFKKLATEADLYGLDEENKLRAMFEDERAAFNFETSLKELRAILLPFARAIQCLEARETTPADVYTYWVAIVAQLHDLILADDSLKTRSRYSSTTKEEIRRIANYRFSELIDNQRSSNIYLTAFYLDPANRSATIYTQPNPLAIQPVRVTLSGPVRATPTVTASKEPNIVARVGKSLQSILRQEYSAAYTEGTQVKDAREKMKEINPYLAEYSPKDALDMLREQVKAYSKGYPPFNRKRNSDESLRDWWKALARFPEARILAALAIKIFSAMPTSIVDERAMSIIKWINSARRNRQRVSTVSNHLAIRNVVMLDEKDKRTKPLSVKWRDMKATIHRKQKATGTAVTDPVDLTGDDGDSIEEGAEENGDELELHQQDWMDADLPEDRLQHPGNAFQLADEFDLSHFRDILSDSAPVVPEPQGGRSEEEDIDEGRGKEESAQDAATTLPDDEEWDRFI